MSNGQNKQSREQKASEFQGGTVYLLDSANSIGDGDTSLTANASEGTTDSDWSITHDTDAGTTTLQNSNPISLGAVSGFVVQQVVVESTEYSGNYLIENSPAEHTDLSGDGETIIEAGDLTYTFGQ